MQIVQSIIKADRPKNLLRNSLLTPSLAASIMNAKYVNGLPLYRISQEFLRNDIHISRQVMVNWITETAKANNLNPFRYLEHVLTVLKDHQDDREYSFINDILPWSEKLPAICRSKTKATNI
mgnify:CR=1 FL=1